jgi:prepilin-type processing-associated H-X9-DG protein
MKLNRSSESTTNHRARAAESGTKSASIPGDWLLVVGRPIRQTNRSAQGRIRPMRLCAFTRVELVVILGLLALLIVIVVPGLSKAKAKARIITCNGHLKNVGLAFRIFATDHGDLFPWQTNFIGGSLQPDEYLRYTSLLSNEFSTPLVLRCPADTRTAVRDWPFFNREHASYLFGINAEETFPQSILAADRNVTTNGVRLGPGRVTIEADANLGWDKSQHDSRANVGMGDGSVQSLTSERARQQLKNTGKTNTVLLIP